MAVSHSEFWQRYFYKLHRLEQVGRGGWFPLRVGTPGKELCEAGPRGPRRFLFLEGQGSGLPFLGTCPRCAWGVKGPGM